MAYTYPGIQKLTWDEVVDIIKHDTMEGYYKLYEDGTESQIEKDWTIDEILRHHNNGGEFGFEIHEQDCYEVCPNCDQEVKIKNIGIQRCPNCGKRILPCSTCGDDVDCNECYYMSLPEFKEFKDE